MDKYKVLLLTCDGLKSDQLFDSINRLKNDEITFNKN